MKLKVGDKVKTMKGCRINGTYDTLLVLDINKKWKEYDACLCQKEDGSKRVFLTKNLQIV